MHPAPRPKIIPQVADYESDPDICEALDEILAEEKEKHQSEIVSFEQKAAKLRSEIGSELYTFKKSYDAGYNALMGELQNIYAESPDEEPLKEFLVDDAHIQALEDKEACDARMKEGTTLADLLGYSGETLAKFYQAATNLLEKNQTDSAKNGFYFLATIAPNYPLFWLGLGFSYALLKEHDLAVKTCEFACSLEPSNIDAYLISSRVYVEFQEYESAIQVLQKGIEYARATASEPWAKDLEMSLQEAVAYVQNNQSRR
jgi:hypothetical protein